jgi:seryl-tRNA synthetase
MSDAAVKVIMEEIEKHQTKLKKLEERRKELETELPLVKANLEALTRSLAILKGETIPTDDEGKKEESILFHTEEKQPHLRKGSSTYFAYLILGSGPSLTPKELFEAVKVKIPNLKKNSFLSGLYTFIRDKKYFKKDDFGKIAILK